MKITKEIKSEAKVILWLYAFDFLFLVFYILGTNMLDGYVYPALKIPYYIFSIMCGIILTLPSSSNKKRRNYQAIMIYLTRDLAYYRPIWKGKKDDIQQTGR